MSPIFRVLPSDIQRIQLFVTPSDLSQVSFAGSILHIDVDSLHNAWNYRMTGSYDSLRKEITIRVPFTTECGSFSGAQTRVIYTAKDRCNIPLIPLS